MVAPRSLQPSSLPTSVSRFVGREGELTTLESLVWDARLLTLTGSGGIGKTRLALELANRLRGRFSDRVWLVELAPLAASTSVERAVARTLQIPEQAHRPEWELLVEALSPCQALLILDNCEHLVDASARLAEGLLRRCFEALPSGGHILLLEMVLDEDRTGPPLPALMSLNMLVATLNGRERTGGEFRRLLERAGFVEPRVQRLHGPRDYVLARKP